MLNSHIVKAQTFLLGTFKGDKHHALLLKEKVKAALVQHKTFEVLERSSLSIAKQEATIAATGLSSSDSSHIDYKIGKYLINTTILNNVNRNLVASFSVIEIASSKIILSEAISYNSIDDDVERVAMEFTNRIERHFSGMQPRKLRPVKKTSLDVEAIATKPKSIKLESNKPIMIKPEISQRDSLYYAAEKTWIQCGAQAYDWELYYKSQRPFKKWINAHSFSPTTASLLASIPGFSGYNYTRQWGVGMFWSFSELIILFFGITRDVDVQKGLILSSLIPLSAFDIILARKSVARENAKIQSLENYYAEHSFPFAFMKGDSNEKN